MFYSVFSDVQFSTHVMFYNLFLGCLKSIYDVLLKFSLLRVFLLCFALDFFVYMMYLFIYFKYYNISFMNLN